MVEKQVIFKRTFGKNTVVIFKNPVTSNWLIEITGEWLTNTGIVYKLGVMPAWNRQVIGMDSEFGLTKTICAWIYDITYRRIPKLESEVIL